MPKRESRVMTLHMQGVAAQPVAMLVGDKVFKHIREPLAAVGLKVKCTVAQLMKFDLKTIKGLRKKDRIKIAEELAKYGLVCGPHILWRPHKILTLQMQTVVKWPAVRLIDINVLERLEDALHEQGHTPPLQFVAHIMHLDLDPIPIPQEDRNHIVEKLGYHGLLCGSHIIWLIQRRLTLAMQVVQNAAADAFFGAELVVRIEQATGEKFATVKDVMMLCLRSCGISEEDQEAITSALKVFGLVCGRYVPWLPERVLTNRMQELMKCHIDEIGISVRTAEALENYADVCILEDLLALDVERLNNFANPESEHNIQNFGKTSLREIETQLEAYGFTPHNCGWVTENNLTVHIAEQFMEIIGKPQPDFLEEEGEEEEEEDGPNPFLGVT